VKKLGAADGIRFDLDRQQACNTRLAHRAVAIAHEMGAAQAHATKEALFSAFFENGQDLSRVDVVAAVLAKTMGGDVASLVERLGSNEAAHQVESDLAQGQALGVTGVPFFVLDNKYALSGAQPATTMVEFIHHAMNAVSP
jgi:predicted DsbA family dithiol-disulfide isomerase